jgi:hypothetical protein
VYAAGASGPTTGICRLRAVEAVNPVMDRRLRCASARAQQKGQRALLRPGRSVCLGEYPSAFLNDQNFVITIGKLYRRCARIRASHERYAEKERIVSWSVLTSPGHATLSWLRGRRSWWTWQRLCALALCTTSPLLYLLASICLATGVFHHETPHQAHHHHPSPDAHHTSGLPDVCDFAQQALTTTVVASVPLLPCVLPSGETLLRPPRFVLPIALVSRHGIRAPPLVHAS